MAKKVIFAVNNSHKSIIGYSVNDAIDASFRSVDYIQTKELVHIISIMGKNAWLWAKDVQDEYCNVQVREKDLPALGFVSWH